MAPFRLCLAIILALSARAAANDIVSYTIDGGGGQAIGGVWTLTGTIGQPDAGVMSNGSYTLQGGFWWAGSAPTSVDENPSGDPPVLPARFAVHPVQPNPSNPATSIAFETAAAGPVQVRIYNLRGELVVTLLDGAQPAGRHQLVWRGRDDRGDEVASGVYIVVVESGGERASRRIVLVR